MAMTDGATRLKSPIVSQAQGLSRSTIHTAMRATIGVVIVLAVAAAFWYARTAIFLAFAGLLLAIVLHGASKALSRISRLPNLVALTIVVALIAGFFAVVIGTLGPTISQQVTQLATSIATGLTNLTQQVATAADERNLFQDVDITKLLSQFSPWGIASGATSVAVSMFGVISALLIVLFFGIYFAADPHTYVQLAARIASEDRRSDTTVMLYQTGDLLRRWLIGQGIAMAVIGGVTYVACSSSVCRSPSCLRCSRVSQVSYLILGQSSAPCPWCWWRAERASRWRCGSPGFTRSCSYWRATCSRP